MKLSYKQWYLVLKRKVKWKVTLVVQWIRIHLPVQETCVWSLVQEGPTCHGATKSVLHNYWSLCSRAQELQLRSPHATAPGVCTPWSPCSAPEKPLQREAQVPQLESSPHSWQLEEKTHAATKNPVAKYK